LGRSEASPRLRLAQLGLDPKRSLGQHFLHDRAIVRRICDVAGLDPEGVSVEVGPGLGILTEELAGRVRTVIAIEKDDELAAALGEIMPANVRIINADALEFDLSEIPDGPYYLVANLPYNVATAILRRFLDSTRRPVSCTVMVQREVAERMVARPPDMGILAVATRFHGEPRIAFRVGRGAFTPPPNVVSAVVHIQVNPNPPLPQAEFEPFFELVRAGFGTRRKQLKNSLSANAEIDAERLTAALDAAGISQQARAQELDVNDWLRLYHALRAA